MTKQTLELFEALTKVSTISEFGYDNFQKCFLIGEEINAPLISCWYNTYYNHYVLETREDLERFDTISELVERVEEIYIEFN